MELCRPIQTIRRLRHQNYHHCSSQGYIICFEKSLSAINLSQTYIFSAHRRNTLNTPPQPVPRPASATECTTNLPTRNTISLLDPLPCPAREPEPGSNKETVRARTLEINHLLFSAQSLRIYTAICIKTSENPSIISKS